MDGRNKVTPTICSAQLSNTEHLTLANFLFFFLLLRRSRKRNQTNKNQLLVGREATAAFNSTNPTLF